MPRVDAMLDGISVALELTDVLATAAIAIPPHPLAGNVHVTWEGPVSKIAKLFGAQDITLGDPDFDPKFMVKATNPDVARNLLTPAIRSQMLAVGVTELAYDDATTHAHVPMAVVFSRRWERPAGLIDESRDGDRVESETWLD